MQHGLAEEWWLRVRDQPAESKDRLAAASILASSLYGQGKYAEAEQMERELLDVLTDNPRARLACQIQVNTALKLRPLGQ